LAQSSCPYLLVTKRKNKCGKADDC
jgi:hypothetical protein